MPLASRLAWRYRKSNEAQEDLVQVAYMGLVKAVDRFDPERGARFSSFVVPTILGELRRHLRDDLAASRPTGAPEPDPRARTCHRGVVE